VSAPPIPRQYRSLWAPDARALDLVGDRWTLLVVRELSGGPRAFVDLERALTASSPEQLHAVIQTMIANGMLTRRAHGTIAPAVEYELTSRSRELLPVVGALARWGYDWTWTPPRDADTIDIGAILRIAPGILRPPVRLRAVAEFTVRVDAETCERYALTIDEGAATIARCDDANADVRVSGSQDDWICALGPQADRSRLHVEGERWLATLLLDGLSGRSRSTNPER
jgi:DNA-binding HxlR family transcriptional regulator